ncbi:MAG: hypothetical protein ACOYNZ_01255 [Rhodoferax sp.]
MSNSNDALLGWGAAAIARAGESAAIHRALEAEERADRAHRAKRTADLTREPSDAELKKRIVELGKENNLKSSSLDNAMAMLMARDAAIAEKDAMILEWMHSTEAFKRLSLQYGKKLGVTAEQQMTDYREDVLDIAEENPKFSKTGLTTRVKKNLGKT